MNKDNEKLCPSTMDYAIVATHVGGRYFHSGRYINKSMPISNFIDAKSILNSRFLTVLGFTLIR